MATPANQPSKRRAAKPARPIPKSAKPPRSGVRKKIPLAVLQAIIRKGLQQAKLRLQYEEDGMQRLLRALREVKPAAKRRKAG